MTRVLAIIAVLAAAGCTGTTHTTATTTTNPVTTTSVPSAGPALPTHAPGAVNPAVTQATIGSTICHQGWTATIRPPVSYTEALKRSQIREWGYADTNPADFEEDHRVPLGSGGAPMDPLNLWPQSRTGPYSAAAKDTIEARVQHDICSGTLTLAQAQAIWLGDWWTATVP